MNISFLGAAKTVTGSCFLVETKDTKFLVDCGMFQGKANEVLLNTEPFSFNPGDLDFMLLTHAHIDHSGRIPKLYMDGFKGTIYATKPTVQLCGIMLPDSGHIQEMENEWTNRKRQRAGQSPIKPLYTIKEATDCLSLFKGVAYDEVISVSQDVRVRFNDAGHILGSAIVEIWIRENNQETKIVFSGDIGNKGMPILRDPSIIGDTDYLIVESTYGDRLHTLKKETDKIEKFINIISETISKGGNVVIPSFAVGRTQELIYDLNKYMDVFDDKVNQILNVPVYVDSPLATSATQIFRENLDCFDEEAKEYIANGDNPLDFPSLKFTQSPEESRKLNEKSESMIIISASGMCEAGRIKHHLKHNLWREESTILFVGYQAEGTLGRKIQDGAKKVRLFGEEIFVNARIETIDGFSGHADKDGLISWIGSIGRKPKKIFVVHGEQGVGASFAQTITDELGLQCIVPSRGESFVISGGNIYEHVPSDKAKKRFKRLAVVEMLETLKEEFDELSEILKSDLKQEKSDVEIDEIAAKLKMVEKSFIEALK
ncbi:MBL fold metallo-hydrolase RNA specificity domain-containing protein [Ruminiclostridium cellulolyticum]|uniref:RNA-metabolising metallo-beta-lactamase n=1 Tax=Ruminiclostridium cellulolyticum (strain ATCC 35319 / DSM 5812 / JCM 6584 / H10) TaxID=394503 RepID=B8I2W7_RUMCH|nr:MBL fold metallo-hydrolase [Ruminiclostridium cellulolyticum]ACL76110.1 RNA-metabolising metallo-beta-lactamase [Ruminiclostridium cellulolyticum H10]